MGEATKVCTLCGIARPLVKFEYIYHRGTRDGRRATCRYCRGSRRPAAYAPVIEAPKRFTRALDSKCYIITSAQNATPVVPEFWAALQVAAKHLDAEIVVIPIRYKNPTSVWSPKQQSGEWWDKAVTPYLHNTRKKLNANLVLAADVKIQPTASSPLTGFEGLTGAESCILGHPKMQLISVPAPSGRFPKLLTTTGACTKRNYTDSKAGKLGAFHHFLGALVVEVEGKEFRFRQVNADRLDGSFTDAEWHYTAMGVTKAPPALGLNMGDTHAKFADTKVDAATFGPGGIVETLQPLTLVWNDLLDAYAVNPHHKGNPFIAAAKTDAGFGNVREEVEHAVEFVRARSAGRKSVIVSSNHDNFLSRWIIADDWKTAGPNQEFYLETALAMRRSVTMTPGGADYADPFRYWVDKLKGKAEIRCLATDERFKLADIECSLHGDKGPNGSRGTIQNHARLGAKTNIGHSHSPGIVEGAYQAGTSTPLRLEYSRGGSSSWLNAHIVTYATGKRAILVVIGNKWRLNS